MLMFRGVIVPSVTLFSAGGAIDWDANAAHFDRLIEHGVDALFALGSTGEAPHLSVDERERMIRWAVDSVGGRVPLLAGVGDTSTSVARRLTRVAEDAGCDGIVAVGPYYWIPEERHLRAYFGGIASATSLPVLLYNYPRFTGYDLSPEFVRDLAADYPNIAGIKETLDSGTHIRRMIDLVKRERDEFSVLCGHDDLAFFALSAGADGVVSSTANFAPELLVDLVRSFREERLSDARLAASRLGRLVEAYRADPCGPAVVKTALRLRGWIDESCSRLPALPLPQDAIDLVRGALEAAGIGPGG